MSLAAPLLLAAVAGSATPVSPVQNVLVIVLDDLGTENLSWWPLGPSASNPAPTPNMQAIAQAGVTFTKCYVQPLCSPTRAAMLSGRYAFDTGLGHNPAVTEELPLAWNSIPEILAQTTNYTSAAFGKWHLGTAGDYQHPIDTGFDYFAGTESNVSHMQIAPNDHHYDWKLVTADALGSTTQQINGPTNDESIYSLSVTGALARQWIQQQQTSWFAYVSLNVPHAPQQVPPLTMLSANTVAQMQANFPHFVPGYQAVGATERKAIYRLAIEALDHEIGDIVAAVNPSNTMVIIIGDNGTPGPVADPAWVRIGKGTVYDAGTRVPLIVRGPVTQFPGTNCSQLISVVDVRDTVVSLAGGTMPVETPASPGVDFTPLIKNPNATPARELAFTQLFDPNRPYVPSGTTSPVMARHDRGITDGTLHYLRIWDVTTNSFIEEAYDVTVDPFETNDLLLPGVGTQNQLAVIQELSNAMTTISGL